MINNANLIEKEFTNNDIIHTDDIVIDFKKILETYSNQKCFLLTDDNCNKFCFPVIKDVFDDKLCVLEIKNGEEYKSVETLKLIWDFLIENKADRNSVLINLGGGVITDIGGFAASTFKRGMDFINIPTSLLAQIDASLGGKTGINYNNLKNEIGVINNAYKVLIYNGFLKTLEPDEFLSGFAEMIKHALIFDEKHFEELKLFYYNDFKKKKLSKIKKLIIKSVKIKEHFIKNDVNDKGIRQTLNFGHTFGHAFESLFKKDEDVKLKHGEAVAFGIVCELYLSVKKINFSQKDLINISQFIFDVFGKLSIPKKKNNVFFKYMLHDKKNISGEIKCVFLEKVGSAVIGNKISEPDVIEAIDFLTNN